MTTDERFAAFDAAHPEVYELFKRYTVQLWVAGRKRYSADAICHRIRWYYAVNPGKDDGFKLNNNYSSRLARKLVAEEPDMAGFFEFRVLRAKEES